MSEEGVYWALAAAVVAAVAAAGGGRGVNEVEGARLLGAF